MSEPAACWRKHELLSPETTNLAGLAITRLLCRELGVVRCSWLKVRVVLELHPSSRLGTAQVDAAVSRHPRRFSVRRSQESPTVIEVRFTPREAEKPFHFLRWVFAQLGREAS